jgi:hypothetical protein
MRGRRIDEVGPRAGRLRIILDGKDDPFANRIVFDILQVAAIVSSILYPMLREALFPNILFALQLKGEASLDVLHCLLQRYLWRGVRTR